MAENWQAIIEKMNKEMAETKRGMAELKEQNNIKLEAEKRDLKRKMAQNEFNSSNPKKLSISRALPAELLNEIFALLSMENAFGILAKMPNGLLARNVRKMLKSIKMAMRNNKWNSADCAKELTISEEGMAVVNSGPDRCGYSFIRAKLPFSMRNFKSPIAYFEVEIVSKSPSGSLICIGFCTQQFPLKEAHLGLGSSIGIRFKCGIYIDGKVKIFRKNYGTFKVKDVIGVGIIHFPNPIMQCFATSNGHLLGKFELPEDFANLQLFPTAIVHGTGDSIRANFGQKEWRFNPSHLLQ